MKQIFKKDHKHFKVKDYIKSGDLFQLYKDNNSGIVWTSLDKNHNHEYYYLSEKYIPHKQKKGFFGFLYLFVQKIMFRYKLKNLKNYINKNILQAMKVLCLGGLMAFSSNAYSQLSGTKTLGTGGDYTSWSALASAIRTSGVNGKLTVTMLNDMSLGGSRVTFQNPSSNKPTSTNQIVIDGNGKTLFKRDRYFLRFIRCIFQR